MILLLTVKLYVTSVRKFHRIHVQHTRFSHLRVVKRAASCSKRSREDIASISLPSRRHILSLTRTRRDAKKAQSRSAEKSAKGPSRRVDFATGPHSPLPGWRGGRPKKAAEPLDHTRAALANDRSIDRREHATILARDLLALVQLGEICENVRSGPPPPLPFAAGGSSLSTRPSLGDARAFFVSRTLRMRACACNSCEYIPRRFFRWRAHCSAEFKSRERARTRFLYDLSSRQMHLAHLRTRQKQLSIVARSS